jgi:steroid delta-isomerase-like uncharacterized protein
MRRMFKRRTTRMGRGRQAIVAVAALGVGIAELTRRLVRRGGRRKRGGTMTEDNKRLARRVLEEMFAGGRLELADELFAAEWVGYDIAMPEPSHGRDGVKQVVQGYRTAFSDLTMTADEQIAEGDRVCTRWTASATQEGEFFGVPATHKQATVTGMTIDRIRDGQIVESRTNWDALGLMQQLGVVSMPSATPAEG